jgi:hypothetical protein
MVTRKNPTDIGSRDKLLDAAVKDVRKWCAPSSTMVDVKKRPDTFWIELFDSSSSSKITGDEAGRFLTSFQLTNRVKWDRAAVAALVIALGSRETFEPTADMPDLVEKVSRCTLRGTRQVSAASKIAFFSRPKAKVLIWDRLARKSAKHRQRAAFSTNSNPEKDYPAFFAACDRALQDERAKSDFNSAVQKLDREFLHGSGVMADRSKIPLDFIERRLLDKLMFAEGVSLERNKQPGGKT